jgi:hypothetical protein
MDYPFGVSNVYDAVCVSGLTITLDYPFGVNVREHRKGNPE